MAKISAGSDDLNNWLHGGYDSDVITTIYGAPGSGKSNFCILVAVSQAKKGKKVIFVDTEGGFSSERVKQIVGEDYKEALKNIMILKPTNFKEQKEAFKKMLVYLKKQVSLIIVDGMTMLYRLDFADAREKDSENENKENIRNTNAELVRQLRLLAEIARKQNIPVVVTNQIYSWEDKDNQRFSNTRNKYVPSYEKKMVAGDILKYWSKSLIELVNDRGRRTAYLRKHRSMPEKNLNFQIVDAGVKKRGWI